MKRIDTHNEQFNDKDLSNGANGAKKTADWLNIIQEELANILIAFGVTLDPAKNNQIGTALLDYLNFTSPILKASNITSGVSRLSCLPDNLEDPVAIGDNDPRLQSLDDYTKTLQVADLITKGPWVDVRAYGAGPSASGATNRTAINAAIAAADGKPDIDRRGYADGRVPGERKSST